MRIKPFHQQHRDVTEKEGKEQLPKREAQKISIAAQNERAARIAAVVSPF